ncbi:hypothetical protein [Metabacillus fastidiosus]|uniref:Uncharacterized protein n=1 Tax=Metabacillus fastidiosus TaxID=1458 RepID=A0ABU6NW47_9BACI|nr:hypothetical protein [Metabacillus fastidiosus]MED4401352.1 hypothetical protein [Metabacillus fastidiosus]MED4462989.1 hypothetical protein [Metabacillus fastidiosus]
MKVHAYDVDESGLIVEYYLIEVDDEGTPIEEELEHLITAQLPQPNFYRPKWTGTEWIEDKTQAEFDEEALLELLIPSITEIENAEFEIKILTILMEVELI